MRQRNGVLADLIARSAEQSIAACRPTLEGSADVLFVHDVFAVDVTAENGGAEELWLMVHSPMPMGLYLAWNWGHPEMPWQEMAAFPDVKQSLEVELEKWNNVDRVVLPCPEALEELARVDSRFARTGAAIEYILTGSSVADAAGRVERLESGPVGLFLGSQQAYRGLDVLLEAVKLLPPSSELPGVVVLAGPDPHAVPAHPRIRALGRVEDVPALLAAVDFLVNTNRFSLFDLSNIEAAAAAKPLLLHAVGGNKALARLGAGVRLFEALSPEALAVALAQMFDTSRETLSALGRASRDCYLRNLTAEAMWQRHLELYDRAGVGATV
jgi:glycosyltransferase involved in cell wall biosynthesis